MTSALRWIVRVEQAVIGLVAVYAVVRLEGGLAVNAAVALAVTTTPAVVRRRYGTSLGPGVALWIATAALLHAVGAMGLYRGPWWYDQVAHAVSASLVAGVGHATVSVLDERENSTAFPPTFRFALAVVVVLAVGVLWELLEFGLSGLGALVGGAKILAVYGVDDIVADLAFNAVGGVLVALWGTRWFDGVRGVVGHRLGS